MTGSNVTPFISPRSFVMAVISNRLDSNQAASAVSVLAREDSPHAKDLVALMERVQKGEFRTKADLERAGQEMEALARQVIRFDDGKTVAEELAAVLASREASSGGRANRVSTRSVETGDAVALNPPLITGGTLEKLIAAGFVKIRHGLVPIPGGIFKMGYDRKGALKDEMPVHRVTLSSFRMARYDLSNIEYKEWVESLEGKTFFVVRFNSKGWPIIVAMGTRDAIERYVRGKKGIQVWEAESYKPYQNFDAPQQPVNLKQRSALLYALMHGVRLPTGAEFEWVAREGGQRSVYIPGTIYTSHFVSGKPYNRQGTTAAVDDRRYANGPFGVSQVVGNVLKWTMDSFESYTSADQIDPSRPLNGYYVEVRGASFESHGLATLRPSFRTHIRPDMRVNTIGVRLVLPGPRR